MYGFFCAKIIRVYLHKNKYDYPNSKFFSSSKKTVYLDKPIFFKKLQLIEGAFSIKQFIIISNKSISDEMFFNENRLGVICKIIEDKPHIIICPHDENIMRALTFYTN